MSELWKIVSKEKDSRLKLIGDEWAADVREEGCVHLKHFSNGETPYVDAPLGSDDVDYMHICELDEFIVRLVALRDMAKKHFGEHWPQ